jgi:hypothetical protein
MVLVRYFTYQSYCTYADFLFFLKFSYSSQFPTLGFIVERFWEIQAHEPEEFWTINCTHTSDEGTASFGWM